MKAWIVNTQTKTGPPIQNLHWPVTFAVITGGSLPNDPSRPRLVFADWRGGAEHSTTKVRVVEGTECGNHRHCWVLKTCRRPTALATIAIVWPLPAWLWLRVSTDRWEEDSCSLLRSGWSYQRWWLVRVVFCKQPSGNKSCILRPRPILQKLILRDISRLALLDKKEEYRAWWRRNEKEKKVCSKLGFVQDCATGLGCSLHINQKLIVATKTSINHNLHFFLNGNQLIFTSYLKKILSIQLCRMLHLDFF